MDYYFSFLKTNTNYVIKGIIVSYIIYQIYFKLCFSRENQYLLNIYTTCITVITVIYKNVHTILRNTGLELYMYHVLLS